MNFCFSFVKTVMKSGSRGGNFGRGNEEEGAPKPLAASLLQEFQNLREKLKNEDDAEAKGAILLFEYFSVSLSLSL